jgi:hypothetical protein
MPTWFLAPIAGLKLPTLVTLESILRLLKSFKIQALECYVCVYVREDWEVDAEWVGFLITGGWLVLIPAVLIGLLLGDEAPWRRVGPQTM